MHLLSRPRRPRRHHEWSAGKAVTFIVTLATTQSVTLGAREAGMSRKSAYALRDRDPAFAAAWEAALKSREGDKVEEVHEPPVSSSQGDKRTSAAPTNWSSIRRQHDEAMRDLLSSRLAKRSSLRAQFVGRGTIERRFDGGGVEDAGAIYPSTIHSAVNGSPPLLLAGEEPVARRSPAQ